MTGARRPSRGYVRRSRGIGSRRRRNVAAISPPSDVRTARERFPATDTLAYFNTAVVGLASRALAAAYHRAVDEWVESGFDYVRGEEAAERARAAVAGLIGADPADVALIASVSAAAGMVASQLGPARPRENVVIGEQEYSSNHFPWRMLAARGYDVRQVPFHDGGLEPDVVARYVDGGTVVVAYSAVQSASGHRTDLRAVGAIAREVGAIAFVDGSQLVGALPVAPELDAIDVLATSDHKFLLNAGRGMGYCYLSAAAQARFTPVTPGWKAGRVPFDSFYGPMMELSPTASRFDNSISWLAAIGDAAALEVFADFGPGPIYARNAELADALRRAVRAFGGTRVSAGGERGSTIVSVALDDDPERVVSALRARSIAAATRDGNLRLSVHCYNDEDDIERVVRALHER